MNSKKLEFNTFLIYFIAVLCFVCIRICSYYNCFAFMGQYASYYVSIIVQVGIIFLLPLLLFKKMNKIKYKETFDFYGFKKISFKCIVLAVILGVVLFVLNTFVANFFYSIIESLGYKSHSSGGAVGATWWTLVLNIICTAVLPAICEETLHRGMLLRGISRLGAKRAILISGLLFGLLHMNIEQFFYATLIGFFFGYIAFGTDSIYPTIILHFMNNALSTFMQFARVKGWAIGSVFTNFMKALSTNRFLGFVVMLLVLVLLFIFLFALSRAIIFDCFKRDFDKQQKIITDNAIRASYFQQVTQIVEGNLNETRPQRVVIDAKEFLEYLKQSIKEEEIEEQQNELDYKAKIFMLGSIALTLIITILTFIWGFL